MRAGLVLLALGLTWGRASAAPDALDPRGPGEGGEPAPLVRLGPPSAPGARVQPAGAEVQIEPSRRSARVTARFTIEAPPGPLELSLPSGLFQVRLRADGAELPSEVERREAPAGGASPAGGADAAGGALPEVRIDPGSGRIYARGQGGPAAAAYLHRATLTVPPSGRLTLSASAVLSSGHDRRRWRRLLVEQSHLLHARPDFFVYHFAAAGPDGPPGSVHIERPPGTSARARVEGGALRVAAAARRAFPLGATLGLGLALGNPELPGEGTVARGLARAGLDLLLPWGDALAVSADLATRFADRHQLAAALVYQLYTPTLPFLIVPLGAHLEAGPALDLYPELRPGLRLGAAAHLSGLGVLLSADLFPQREPPPAGEAGPDRTVLRYRLGLLLALSL